MKLVRPVLVAFAVLLIGATATACMNPAPEWDPGPPWDANPTTAYIHTHPYSICTRAHESDRGDKGGQGLHDHGYQATNGKYRGAYQFWQVTWDNAAREMGRPDLVGRDPATVGIIDQDAVFWHASWGGTNKAPWGGRC